MSLYIASLNSGSNGNCYYIGNKNEGILVDAGISCLETEKRMARMGLAMEKIKAIFISHEHSDHINGLTVLSKKYQLPVYITEGTQKNTNLRIEKKLVHRFFSNQPVQVGDLCITPFKKNHDAADPHSFIVGFGSIKIGVFTDIGVVCQQLIHHFQQCHAAFLEANYDAEMLANGTYPFFLKQRITNGMGHLSNDQALELFQQYRPPLMSHLVLSHLSKNNNNPDLVRNLFKIHAHGIEIVLASRFEETQLYCIANEKSSAIINEKKFTRNEQQLSLF